MSGAPSAVPLVEGLRALLVELDRLRRDLSSAFAAVAPQGPLVPVAVQWPTDEAEFLRAYA